jgi:hypothetical protein
MCFPCSSIWSSLSWQSLQCITRRSIPTSRDRFRSYRVERRHNGGSCMLTRSRRSAWAQHPCCRRAELVGERRVHRNRLPSDRSRRRWQLITADRFRSQFREGPTSEISRPVPRCAAQSWATHRRRWAASTWQPRSTARSCPEPRASRTQVFGMSPIARTSLGSDRSSLQSHRRRFQSRGCPIMCAQLI